MVAMAMAGASKARAMHRESFITAGPSPARNGGHICRRGDEGALTSAQLLCLEAWESAIGILVVGICRNKKSPGTFPRKDRGRTGET